MSRGANVVDISKVVGHKDLNTALGYIYVAPERLHGAVANLSTVATIMEWGSDATI